MMSGPRLRITRGVTLIEVLVSIAILASVAIGALLAHGRAVANIAECRRELQAAQIAAELFANWKIESTNVLVPTEGIWPLDQRWSWSRRSDPTDVVNGKVTLITLSLSLQDDAQKVVVWNRSFCWLVSTTGEHVANADSIESNFRLHTH